MRPLSSTSASTSRFADAVGPMTRAPPIHTLSVVALRHVDADRRPCRIVRIEGGEIVRAANHRSRPAILYVFDVLGMSAAVALRGRRFCCRRAVISQESDGCT